MEINMIQKLDEWYKEWRGVSHLEESNVQVLDSSEAQDFARFCIDEFQALQASENSSKLLLADVSESANICTRIEVITNKGREYVNWKPTNKIVSVMQDNGKTMKVIVK